MGGLVPAFEKIGTPYLARDVAKGTNVFFEQAKRDEKLKKPYGRLCNLRFDNRRHRMVDKDLFPVLFRQVHESPEAALGSCLISDVAAEQGAAAVEFKVKIPSVRFRLDKELNTAVLVNRRHVCRMPAPDVLVICPE